ncbi:hypothetical protein, partial [Pseudomonas aeruginosa]|uniref:hypothetical protein n=1 Tax=Pseudomonas aeruginosa TaxID=287 RepID=UPI001A9CBE00
GGAAAGFGLAGGLGSATCSAAGATFFEAVSARQARQALAPLVQASLAWQGRAAPAAVLPGLSFPVPWSRHHRPPGSNRKEQRRKFGKDVS